ncbi:MAG: GAF domain-containing protein [Chloroflexi bacterium]|nr:GAF domain-containing protein [Chloroflexota bacterium]
MLCEATGAEAAELFLAEPEGRGMVLAGHRGLFRHDFSQITRFDPGEGFPGLALAHREPILTNRLNEDARYLRTRVKERGIRSYVCVPLCGPEGVIGSIHVASRNPDFALGRALSLLSWASVPISMAVQAGLLSLRELGNRSSLDPRDDLESGFRHTLGQVLHRMVSVSGAQGGSLDLVRPGKKGLAERVIEGSVPVSSCPALEGDASLVCPALARGQSVVLYEQRKSWPPPCQESPRRGSVCYCVPLLVDGETIGVARIVYQGQSPSPPTRNLVAAEKVGEAAARTIRDAWNYLERERRKDAAHRAWLQVGTDAPWETGLRTLPRLALVQQEDVQEGAPYLDIRCFGSFELYRDGSLITPDMVHRRKAIALLKILLTYDGRPVTKDTLIELLWPEVKPEAGAGRLYVLVHELRRLVEPPRHEGKWVFIQNEGDRYHFNTKASCRVDVREFKALVNLGQRAKAKGDIEAAIYAYEAAAEIYRGDFLEDEPFADWCWEQREHLREVCLDALRRLAAIYAKSGEWEQSVRYLRSALRIDKLREEVHRELMRSLWAAGRHDEALRQYEVCKELLLRELDVAPLSETDQLLERIRNSPRA